MDDYNTKDFLQRRGRKPLDEVLERLLRLFKEFRLVYKRTSGKSTREITLYFERSNLFYFDDEIIVIIEPSFYFDDSPEAAGRRDFNKLKIIKVSEVIEIAGF